MDDVGSLFGREEWRSVWEVDEHYTDVPVHFSVRDCKQGWDEPKQATTPTTTVAMPSMICAALSK